MMILHIIYVLYEMIFSFMKVKDRDNNADLDIETGGRKSRV